MIERQAVDFDLRRIGIHMPRARYQRGSLRTSVPATKRRPERKLPRGMYWAQWYQYLATANGGERRRRREKIIDRSVAEKYRIALSYAGPLMRSDAQRVLDLLIAEDSGIYVRPNTEATFAQVAREYMELSKPNWGPHMVRGACNLIVKHLIDGSLGGRPVVALAHVELQTWINGYVQADSSSSLLKGLLYHTRAALEHAIDREIIERNPARKLKAKSKKRPCERTLTMDECQRLLSTTTGRDHLIISLFIQLGLRPEELFGLRRADVEGERLRIDEAIVEMKPAAVKTRASDACVYVPPALLAELQTWLECSDAEPQDWLFTPRRGRGQAGPMNANNYRERVLQPAAIRAGIGVRETGKRDKKGQPILTTDVTFQALRRTCATLFGGYAKDPKSTQAQLRHADPTVTLRHYQKSIPESVKAAAIAFETALNSSLNRTGIEQAKGSR
jgi:integrase